MEMKVYSSSFAIDPACVASIDIRYDRVWITTSSGVSIPKDCGSEEGAKEFAELILGRKFEVEGKGKTADEKEEQIEKQLKE